MASPQADHPMSSWLIISGAPAGAEGARVRSTIAIEIGNPSSRENLDVTSVRTHGLGLETSLLVTRVFWREIAPKVRLSVRFDKFSDKENSKRLYFSLSEDKA